MSDAAVLAVIEAMGWSDDRQDPEAYPHPGAMWEVASDVASAVVEALNLRTEFGWAPEGDASNVRVSLSNNREHAEQWVRQQVADFGGSVFERGVTEWRQEP